MPVLALALLLLLPVAAVALMPLMLIARYRAGRARRLARPWIATLNVLLLCFSVLCFLLATAVTNVWVDRALAASLAGLGVGCILGVVGLQLSRWEVAPGSLHYTPNRWLVLAITLVVAAKVLYGVARAWSAWSVTGGDTSLIAAFGIPGSLGAAGVVLGYYLAYGIGLRRRISQLTAAS